VLHLLDQASAASCHWLSKLRLTSVSITQECHTFIEIVTCHSRHLQALAGYVTLLPACWYDWVLN